MYPSLRVPTRWLHNDGNMMVFAEAVELGVDPYGLGHWCWFKVGSKLISSHGAQDITKVMGY
jgi:hypothetical protein